MALLAELSGWLGALAVLAGYASFSLGWIANGRIFQACNLLGSAALMLNGLYHDAWPSVSLNIAWATISCVALIRALRAERSVFPGGLRAPAARAESTACEELARGGGAACSSSPHGKAEPIL
ncbi:CBU_0592 family membrane protein [Arthrobacter sp. 2RAF6]|uniref:CBU_0592 family membrane protein n=1 Tax=Arthrobacter sp. 2RAF6 TaxID=3233002 RepID=UPI003F928410